MWRTEHERIAGQALAWRRGGAGPPVLYLHDAGADTLTSPALRDLAHDHEVVVPWLPGYGSSAPPDPGTSPQAMGRLVAGLLERLGWTRAALLGCSLGGWFALEAALAAPDAVSGVVACDAAGLQVPEDYLLALFADGHAADRTEQRLTAALATALPAAEQDVSGLPPALASAILGPFVQQLAAAAGCGWHPALANPRLLGRLPEVRCPVTLLWGAADPLVPLAHGRAMADALPRGRLEVLDGVGHLPPLQAPDAVAAAVRTMVAERPLPSSTSDSP